MQHLAFLNREISRVAIGDGAVVKPASEADSFRLLDLAFEKGINVIDTARVYGLTTPFGAGYSEEALGRYFRSRSSRNDWFLVSKGAHPPVSDMTMNRLTRTELTKDLDSSLKALGTDRIDLYFLHRDNEKKDLPELMETLDGFVKSGRVGAIGASNWRLENILKANAYAEAHELTPFSASQIRWNLLKFDDATGPDPTTKAMREDEVDGYRASSLLVMCYNSQAKGILSRALAAGGYEALKASGGLGSYTDPDNRRRIEAALRLADELGVSPAAVALAYLTSQDFPVMPILGCSTADHLNDALSAPDLKLTDEQLALLDGR